MLAGTHLAFGFLLGLLLEKFFGPTSVVLFYTLVLFGSLLPDIDHEGAMINRLFPVTRWFSRLFRHRGIFHTLFMAVFVGLIVASVLPIGYGIALFVGYLSHLLIDSVTRHGVNWIYPLSSWKLRGPLRTGGISEYLLFYFFILVNGYLLYVNR